MVIAKKIKKMFSSKSPPDPLDAHIPAFVNFFAKFKKIFCIVIQLKY